MCHRVHVTIDMLETKTAKEAETRFRSLIDFLDYVYVHEITNIEELEEEDE